MEKTNQLNITGKFNWEIPQVSTSFVSGEDARAIYESMREMFGERVWYDEESKTMKGSNFPIAARLDTILRQSGIRVANLADLSRPEVMKMIKDRHYTDTPELTLTNEKDSYEPNNSLIKKLLPIIEGKQGRLQLPVKIAGLDVVLEDNEYGWNVIPRDDFNIVYDDRLQAEHSDKCFSSVDSLGFPIFDKEGKRTWYTREGLSWMYLDRELCLDLDYGNLADSDEGGRVVLIAAHSCARKFLVNILTEIEAEYKREESELLKRKERALKILSGKESITN